MLFIADLDYIQETRYETRHKRFENRVNVRDFALESRFVALSYTDLPENDESNKSKSKHFGSSNILGKVNRMVEVRLSQ